MSLTLVAPTAKPLNIAVIGTGISGMAAAWLLSQKHQVTVYEKNDRIGGHTNTVTVADGRSDTVVDTGFIVYNERNYRNLVALLDHLGVPTRPTDMSFAASLDDGLFEYSDSGLKGLLAQPRNAVRPRMWSLLRDLRRFHREVPRLLDCPSDPQMTLGDYLLQECYGDAFVRDHLLPMGAAIWSTPVDDMLRFPLTTFVRFYLNHGLSSVSGRPVWRTLVGGSRQYVRELSAAYRDRVRLNTAVRSVSRLPGQVMIEDRQGESRYFDHVVIATHADQALGLLADPDTTERRLLARFRYERNLAILHTDRKLMPRIRRAWASWNFMSRGRGHEQKVSVSYWLNRLQQLPTQQQLFFSLNPLQQPAPGTVLRTFLYEHPLYDQEASAAQRLLWSLQGVRRTWYCGAYFGHGFHEDGLQAGLAVAEQLGGMKRPWKLENPNNRIHCAAPNDEQRTRERAA